MSVTEEKEQRVKDYLQSYRIYKEMLYADRYAKEYADAHDIPLCDSVILQAKMYEIEQFIKSLPVCREQNMLFQHFVRGHSVEFCGEMLDVSRRTAFRLIKRAISFATQYYEATFPSPSHKI